MGEKMIAAGLATVFLALIVLGLWGLDVGGMWRPTPWPHYLELWSAFVFVACVGAVFVGVIGIAAIVSAFVKGHV